MNDFLQNLRNGQADKTRTAKTRKSQDNGYHYSSAPRFHSYSGGFQNTRNQQMKRPVNPAPASNKTPSEDMTSNAMLIEAIESLGAHVENLTRNQDALITVQEKTADMLERQAIAIEHIAEALNLNERKTRTPAPKKAFRNHYIASQKPRFQSAAPAEEPQAPARQARTIIRKRKGVVTRKPVESAVSSDVELLSREEVMDIIYSMREEGATFDQVASRLIELGQPTFSGRGEWHAQTIHRLCNK